MKWDQNQHDWTVDNWKKVVKSDESSFYVSAEMAIDKQLGDRSPQQWLYAMGNVFLGQIKPTFPAVQI